LLKLSLKNKQKRDSSGGKKSYCEARARNQKQFGFGSNWTFQSSSATAWEPQGNCRRSTVHFYREFYGFEVSTTGAKFRLDANNFLVRHLVTTRIIRRLKQFCVTIGHCYYN